MIEEEWWGTEYLDRAVAKVQSQKKSRATRTNPTNHLRTSNRILANMLHCHAPVSSSRQRLIQTSGNRSLIRHMPGISTSQWVRQ